MLSRLLAGLRDPRLLIPAGFAAGLAALTGVLRFFTDNWLVILIAVLSVVLVVLLVLVVRMLLGQERAQRREAGLADADQAAGVRASAQSERTLQERVREALATVKERLGSVYELPWFLVLGEAGSGKSALLAASGLDVPADYSRARVFGATQNVDFVLANQAIGIDVAGRYFDGGEADTAEWRSLLRLLASGRPDCPVNGVVFTLPATSVLGKSAEALAESARQLRRRINELSDGLGVYAPIYLVITKADAVEGFVETAEACALLSSQRPGEAFGWTNDQSQGVLADAVSNAFVEIAERLDQGLPELLLREPDGARRRRVFGFPQELREVGRRTAEFVATAFKPSMYDEAPFLRGVYLVAARPQGEATSTTLLRLGHDWAHASYSGNERGGLFARDLFLDVIAGDRELAIPESRVAPLAQRLILGAAGLGLVVLLGLFGLSFWQNLDGSSHLAVSARMTTASEVRFADLDGFRKAIETEGERAGSLANRVGFGRLGSLVERARAAWVATFDRHFDSPLRARLTEALEQRDARAVKAAVATATDMDWLAARGEDSVPAPELGDYLAGRVPAEEYKVAYASFASWLPEPEWRAKLDRGRSMLADAAPRILDVGLLEELTRGPERSYPSVGYPPALAAEATTTTTATETPPAPETTTAAPVATAVPGIYSRRGFEGLVALLLASVERSEALPRESVGRFRRTYAERFDASWRRYLLEVPDAPRVDSAVKQSPYLVVLDELARNTSAAVPRDEPAPSWITGLAELRAEQPPAGAERAPWTEYTAALENVAIDVDDGVARAPRGLELANDVAGEAPTSFEDALGVVRKMAPRGADSAASAKLRKLAELPVLDGFSAVLASAQRELDRQWQERIARPFDRPLDEPSLASLYGPQGELQRFQREALAAYYDDSGPRVVLGDRALPFGPAFLDWMKNAAKIQRTLFASASAGQPTAVRLGGLPTRGLEGSGLVAKRREVELACPGGVQSFRYREGSPSPFTFQWTSACQEVSLVVVLAADEDEEQRVQQQWRGPLALPTFLRQAVRAGPDELEWKLRAKETEFRVPFRLSSGAELVDLVHSAPPPSLGS